MSKKFIVIVIDSFGIGAMDDVTHVRSSDIGANTLGSILKKYPNLQLPTLEKLGLMNVYGKQSKNMKFSKEATCGTSMLAHHGADSFLGHQEIVGTIPDIPEDSYFQKDLEKVKEYLQKNNHQVEVRGDKLQYLLVDKYCTVADNIDSDLGMAYNVTAPLDYIDYELVLEIGKQVRKVVKTARVIAFGGTGNNIDDLFSAVETKNDKYIGINAPKSKSYVQGYQCRHLGLGSNPEKQIQTILTNNNSPVTFIGKVADIVINEKGKSISCVPTEEVLDKTIYEIKNLEKGLIISNIQETDLAGHAQNTEKYKNLVVLCDKKIGEMLPLLAAEDILLVMADHGNDPGIGHNRHTRENVPLLIYSKTCKPINFGIRKTMADVAATIAEYFHSELPRDGSSFLKDIQNYNT